MKQINEQRRRNYEFGDNFLIEKHMTNCYQNQIRKNQVQVKSFLVLIIAIYSSHAVADALPANDASYDLPSQKQSDQLSLMRYFPGEDDTWAQQWTNKLVEQLNNYNLLKHDSHQAEKKAESGKRIFGKFFGKNWQQLEQALENSFPEASDEKDVINDEPESNNALSLDPLDRLTKGVLKRVPSYNSWRKGKRVPSYNSWRKGKRVPSYNSWRKGKRVPSYNSWRKGKRSNMDNSGMKRDSYTAWRKGKRGPSYNSWRKGKRGPSYNSWRKGKRSIANNFSKNFFENLMLEKQGYYYPSMYDSFLAPDEQENEERGQEEEALSSFPASDQLIESTENQRYKREIKVASESTDDKKRKDDFILRGMKRKEETDTNNNTGTGAVFKLHPNNEAIEAARQEKSSKLSNYGKWNSIWLRDIK